MSLAEAPFQLVELRRREPRPVPLLLVGLAGVVAVGPAAPATATRVNGGGGRGGQSVAGRGQVETAARQPERPAAVAGSGGGRRQL